VVSGWGALTHCVRGRVDLFAAFWIPAFAGMTGLEWQVRVRERGRLARRAALRAFILAFSIKGL